MYKCPKCGGTKLYYANKQIEQGVGFYRYSTTEKRPFCHTHDIEAVWYGKRPVDWGYGFTVVVGILLTSVVAWAFYTWVNSGSPS